jgi:formylmethanofuran dehydrogenase subunit E
MTEKMKYPEFYKQIEAIVVYDPLADFLGAFEEGIIEYSYLDVVRLAGHSCPTVAGAYLMAARGLKTLFRDELPVRGEINVAMQQNQHEGVCGVIANVFSYITGATQDSGFHGLANRFDRRHLLSFGKNIPATVRFTRKSNGHSVLVSYDSSFVPADPDMSVLLSKAVSDQANVEEELHFRQIWQNRVEAILCDYANDPRLLMIKSELD